MKRQKPYHLLFLFICLCYVNHSYAQSRVTRHRCALTGDQSYIYPDTEEIQQLEQEYRRAITQPKSDVRNNQVRLPVVVHIIHQNGAENISDAQVIQGIQWLNDAFGNKGNFYHPDGVDTNIDFCLAQRTPDGQATDGIVRYESIYTNMETPNSFNYIMDNYSWDEEQYLNIRLLLKPCSPNGTGCEGLVGFGGVRRGVVMKASYFGSTIRDAKATTHEAGHALGLLHTFTNGCPNNDCLMQGDKVCDTPPDNKNWDFCASPKNSCYTDDDDLSAQNPYRPVALGGLGDQYDMNNNYLDYNIPECVHILSQGQADRMHFIIDRSYKGLLSAKSCLAPCPAEPLAHISVSQDTFDLGSTVSLSNSSQNANEYQWYINGVAYSQSTDISYTFSQLGTYTIALTANNGDHRCEGDSTVQQIHISCPAEACISYSYSDQYLHMKHCGTAGYDSLHWVIDDGNGNIIHESDIGTDSIYLNNIPYVELCLSSYLQGCSEYLCIPITLQNDGSEICTNEIDDDGDGLIDLFDPDCPCNDEAYQAQCPSDCEIVPDSFPDFEMQVMWESEIFVSDNNAQVGLPKVYKINDKTEIVYNASKEISGVGYNSFFYKINPKNGIVTDSNLVTSGLFYSFPRMSNIWYHNELFIGAANSDSIYILDNSFNKRISVPRNNRHHHIINSADFDQNGIPELYINNTIINSLNGNVLIEDTISSGCNGLFGFFNDLCSYSHTVAADLTAHEGLELAAGKKVYEIDLTNPNDSLGNDLNVISAPTEVLDGYTSIGDIDLDGNLDVIVVRGSEHGGGGIWVWNPRNQSLIAQAAAGEIGGIALISDLDNDCLPEIAVTFREELRVYKYNGSENLELLWSKKTTDESGRTGVTSFDFNQDGKTELIYRDQDYLRIIDGVTGITIDSTILYSTTWLEYPVIADVDLDGQAEILISGSKNNSTESRLYCFESAGAPWAPARSVWHQYAYNPTYVNDDLSIPRYPQNTAQALQGTESCERETCNTPYNNFMVQATYRTQEGCLVWPSEECNDEDCGNGLDDDGDGLVDLFDPDCPCNDEAYQAQCPSDCEIVPDSFPDFEMQVMWETINLGENTYTEIPLPKVFVDNDSIKILSPFKSRLNSNTLQSNFGYINPTNGNIGYSASISSGNISTWATRNCIWKLDDEFYIGTFNNDTLYILDEDFNITGKGSNVHFNSNSINVTDFNLDGLPELYINSSIYNAKSAKKLIGSNVDRGCNLYGGWFLDECTISHTIASDLTDSYGLELACGNIVYEISISNTLDSIGNSMSPIFAPPEVLDGFTSTGDIDMDGHLDVIVVRGSQHDGGGGIWVWNPRNQTIIARAEAGEYGGVAFVGDIDGDCQPEIGVTFKEELRMYSYNGTQQLQLLWNISTSDQSGQTGVTMFDFNQDSKNELIYRDESQLKIIDGQTGNVISSYPMVSGTGIEYPIIADIDKDGQAEIIIAGHESSRDSVRLYCFESAGAPWAPARSVWHQYAYNPTYVNDDLSIPRYPQNTAQALQGTESCERETCSTPYNNFMVQATYRTQEGCLVWPSEERDLSITASAYCMGDSLEICFYATSTDTITIRQGVNVTCYQPPWDNGSDSLIDSIRITQDTTCIIMPNIGLDSIMVVINDGLDYYPPDFPNTGILECDYSNNDFVLHISGPDYTIDSVYYDCTADSLIYYLIIDNIGEASTDSCIDIACYDLSGLAEQTAMEVSSWCAEYDTSSMSYIYSDTIRIATAQPTAGSTIIWSINDTGQGPGIYTLEECNIDNNQYQVDVHTSTGPPLDIGPDITMCRSEVITLDATMAYESYFWSDLTTESTFSTSIAGLHSVTVTDACGNVQTDSIRITIDDTYDVQLGADTLLCPGDSLYLSVSTAYLSVQWLPEEAVSCDSCHNTTLVSDTAKQIIVIADLDGCFSSDTMLVSYRDSIILMDSVYTCSGQAWMYGDSIWHTDETRIYALNDCDSFVSVSLLSYPADTSYITELICEGDSLWYNGQWISDSAVYYDTLSSAQACDSIIALSLDVTDMILVSDSLSICTGDSIYWSEQWLYDIGSYQDTSISAAGCDSITQIILGQLPDIHVYDTIHICAGDTLDLWSEQFSEATDYIHITSSQYGCDSTIHLHLVLDSLITSIIDIDLCESDSIWLDQSWHTAPSEISILSENAEACDSLVHYMLHSIPSVISYDTLQYCMGDTVQVLGFDIWESQVVSESLLSSSGCDSTHQIWVDFLPSPIQYDTLYICTGDTIDLWNMQLSEAGDYSEVFATATACDSTVHIHLIVDTLVQRSISEQICHGDSISIYEEWYSESGNYEVLVPSEASCDTLLSIGIELLAIYEQTDTLYLCEGDTLAIADTLITTAADLHRTYTSALGCDSLMHYHIELLRDTLLVDSILLCPQDSIWWIDQYYYQDTSITQHLMAANGCDSTHIAHIQMLAPLDAPAINQDCESGTSTASLVNSAGWQILWSNGDTTMSSQYATSGPASVSASNGSCIQEFSFDIAAFPSANDLPALRDTVIALGQSLDLSLGLDTSSWTWEWMPSEIIDCHTCADITITPISNIEISLYAVDALGCAHYSSFWINIEAESEVVVPNIFSPNDDGINDHWSIKAKEDITLQQCYIYDRWGNQVFHAHKPDEFSWNGYYNGRQAITGVYVYWLEYIDKNGNTQNLAGDITLIR